jgi:hypothetical protein
MVRNKEEDKVLLKRFSLAMALAMFLAACGGSDAGEAAAGEPATSEQAMDDNMTEEAMDDNMTEEAMDDDMTEGHTPAVFTVTIQNTSDTADLPTPLAPGLFAVHNATDAVFAEDEPDRGQGLEALAEDGDPTGLVASLEATTTVKDVAAFAVPDGATEAGPALPGSSYSFTFEATPGNYLSFATMFVQSNDWFFAPAPGGLSLFDGDTPLEGDITELVLLWDAGTEVDETPGEGPNQAPRQAGPNTGDAQDAPIATVGGFAGSIAVSVEVSG